MMIYRTFKMLSKKPKTNPATILLTLLLTMTLTGCETLKAYRATQKPGIIVNTRCEAHARQFCGKKRKQVFTEKDWKRCRQLPKFPRAALNLIPTETLAGLRAQHKSIQKCPR